MKTEAIVTWAFILFLAFSTILFAGKWMNAQAELDACKTDGLCSFYLNYKK